MSARHSSAEKHSNRSELERLHKEFLEQKFPIVDGGEELDELHDSLVLYGADVAAAVEKVLVSSRSSPDLRNLSGLRENKDIQRELDRIMSEHSGDDEIGQSVRKYANYYGSLKKLIRATHSYLNSSNQ